jgi:uncharacterized protein (TIRG00374 family)
MRYFLAVIVLIVVSFVVAKNIDFKEVLHILSDFPKLSFMPLIMLAISILLLKAWRFSILLKANKIQLNFWQSLKSSIAGSAVSPLPGGEMFRSVLLNLEIGKKVNQTGSSILAQAFFELASAVMLMIIGAMFYENFLPIGFAAFVLLGLLLTLISSPSLLKLITEILPSWEFIKKGHDFIKKIRADYARVLFTTKTSPVIKFHYHNIKKGKRFRSPLTLSFHIQKNRFFPSSTLLKVILLSLLGHFVGGALLFLIANGLNVDINPINTLFIYTCGIVISGLSTISPGGLGFTEGGMVGVMLFFGVGLAEALTIVLLFRFMTLFFSVILGLLFIGIFYSRPLFFEKKLI